MRRIQICILLLSTWIFIPADAQVFSEDRLKAEFSIILSDYISWEGEDTLDQFTVGVFGSNEVFSAFSLKSESGKLKGKPFTVRYFRRLKEIVPVNILYVGREKNGEVKRVYNKIQGQQILMITDSCLQYENIMLNLLALNRANQKSFELNKMNFDEAGLQVSQRIIYRGGSEEDLRDIYDKSKEEMEQLKGELAEQKEDLRKLNEELGIKLFELELRRTEIIKLSSEIESQQLELDLLADNISQQNQILVKQTELLDKREQEMVVKEKQIELQNQRLLLQQDEIVSRNKVLRRQEEEIEIQKSQINEQSITLNEQNITISRQKGTIFFFAVVLLFFLILVYFIVRAYNIKKRTNLILKEKNAAIYKQNEEILAQREQLEIVNKEIESQNENIKAGIYYALTIQHAILPAADDILKFFPSFIIYMPKDIVSGDFYWFSSKQDKKKNVETSFIAVVDCTGHGVPGGFLSMIGSRMLSNTINEKNINDPARVLTNMDKVIRAALRQDKTDNDDGMDVCLCRIERPLPGEVNTDQSVKITFAGARRPLYVASDGEINMIRGNRKTIGGRFQKEQKFEQIELNLKKGDKIYLTTDGLTDQHSPEREKFGIPRFTDFLSKSGKLSMEEQKSKLENSLLGFMKYAKQRDDITIMGIEI